MYAGLDFGTSNCALGIWRSGAPELLNLERGTPFLPSVFYSSKRHIEIEQPDPTELNRRIKAALSTQKSTLKGNPSLIALTPEEMKRQIIGVMRFEAAQKSRLERAKQTLKDTLFDETDLFFGTVATEMHISEPLDGLFAKSPKSFLGSDLGESHLNTVAEICTRMFAHIKEVGEKQTKKVLDSVVIGRPVNFHSSKGESANRQALSILGQAAETVGFKNYEFLIEPIAAAMDFERHLLKETLVLVLDIGGGTTDCSLIQLGPEHAGKIDRVNNVLGSSGARFGGLDIDIKFAMKTVMPELGSTIIDRSGLPLPTSIFWDAVTTNDVNCIRRFFSDESKRQIDSFRVTSSSDTIKIQRLVKLHQERLSYRLIFDSEEAKKDLSDTAKSDINLEYLESLFHITATRDQLNEVVSGELLKVNQLVKETIRQAGVSPKVIYLTGGSAKSPIVRQWLHSEHPQVEIVAGDMFGGVCKGLTTRAHKLFRTS